MMGVGPGIVPASGGASTSGTNTWSGSNSYTAVVDAKAGLDIDSDLNGGDLRMLGAGSVKMIGATDGVTIVARQRQSTDTKDRVQLRSDGVFLFGDGSNATLDTNLYRSAADTLKTDDSFAVGAALLIAASNGQIVGSGSASGYFATALSGVVDWLRARRSGDADYRFSVDSNGKIKLGDGTNPADTSWQRTTTGGLAEWTTTNTVTLGGGARHNYVAKSSNYTLLLTDYTVEVTGTTTITLPSQPPAGTRYEVVNVGTGSVTISRGGADTINGATTEVIPVQYQSRTLAFDGTSIWRII